jgi:hypothetical protein
MIRSSRLPSQLSFPFDSPAVPQTETVDVNPGSGSRTAVRLTSTILPDGEAQSSDSRPRESKPTRSPVVAPIDQSGRRCLACGGVTRIVRASGYRAPVEKCDQCGLERELPRATKTGPAGRGGAS